MGRSRKIGKLGVGVDHFTSDSAIPWLELRIFIFQLQWIKQKDILCRKGLACRGLFRDEMSCPNLWP